jgi:predicted GH43/DUF377 family glycosyl hydrolase
MNSEFIQDKIVITPADVDLSQSPLRNGIEERTYVLGAFNPGLVRLPNGNLLMMVRVAESLENNIDDNKLRVIRKPVNQEFKIDEYCLSEFYTNDPRKYLSKKNTHTKIYALTSFSWLLPVELSVDGLDIVNIHYDKIIYSEKGYQEYGIEDARITKINSKYYMTVCCVGSERHSTALYFSENGLDYQNLGIIMDHQNKDMVLFPEKINEYYYALTRPLGDHYFISSASTDILPGPSINIAQSPDLLHWRPIDSPLITLKKNSLLTKRLGAGAQPILTDKGWLILFHGVQNFGEVGTYETYYAFLEKDDPTMILELNIKESILQANKNLTDKLDFCQYVDNVVFTTGIEEFGELLIVASGELDLCCRITHISKNFFLS